LGSEEHLRVQAFDGVRQHVGHAVAVLVVIHEMWPRAWPWPLK
jgi:hypothetical protein